MTEAAATPKPKRKLTPQRVMVALGWAPKPPDSDTPQGRSEDLFARLGVKGGALGAVVWAIMQGVAAMNRQSAALESLSKATAAGVAQSTQSTATLERLVSSTDLNRREQELTTREVSGVKEEVRRLGDAIGVRRGETEPVAASVPGPKVQGFRGRR